MDGRRKTDQNALLIFLKYPEPGRVKTRLHPEMTLSKAAELYKAMVDDILSAHSNELNYECIIVFTPSKSLDKFTSWLGDRHIYIAQQGFDIGDRLFNAFSKAFAGGFKRVIAIGSDCLQISGAEIQFAFDTMYNHDIVIGPTEDGGYYLIGMKESHENIFRNISWSSDRVLRQTLDYISYRNLSYKLLDSKFDIDTYQDVIKLWELLESGEIKASATNTYRILNLWLAKMKK